MALRHSQFDQSIPLGNLLAFVPAQGIIYPIPDLQRLL